VWPNVIVPETPEAQLVSPTPDASASQIPIPPYQMTASQSNLSADEDGGCSAQQLPTQTESPPWRAARRSAKKTPQPPATCPSPRPHTPPTPPPCPRTRREDAPLSLRLDAPCWGLTSAIVSAFKKEGVTELYPWQLDLLGMKERSVLQGTASLVYSAPTSGGKTLVAEMLVLQRVLHSKRNVLIVLPYVALIKEMVPRFKRLVGANSVCKVMAFHGGSKDGQNIAEAHIAICTPEKATELLNSALDAALLRDAAGESVGQDSRAAGDLPVVPAERTALSAKRRSAALTALFGAIVVDEVHMLSDCSRRGATLEALVTQLRFLSSQARDGRDGGFVQIIAMSATVPHGPRGWDLLRVWLDAEFYCNETRPVALCEQLVCVQGASAAAPGGTVRAGKRQRTGERPRVGAIQGGEVWGKNGLRVGALSVASSPQWGKTSSENACLALCLEAMQVPSKSSAARDGAISALVFCNTKQKCVSFADCMHKALVEDAPLLMHEQHDERSRLAVQLKGTGRDRTASMLAMLALAGVSFHHSGLTDDQRALVEGGFRRGVLTVLAATSTLAAGVNLPASLVVISSPWRYRGGSGVFSALSPAEYSQMAGRAGRKNLSRDGRAVLVVERSCEGSPVSARDGTYTREEGLALMNAPLDDLMSALDPTSSRSEKTNPYAIACVLLEALAADLIYDVDSGVAYLRHSLFFFLRAGDNEAERSLRTETLRALEFLKNPLHSAPILSRGECSVRLASTPTKDQWSITPVGRAVVAAALPPAVGAALFYDMRHSQRGINVAENGLHVMSLLVAMPPVATRACNIELESYLTLNRQSLQVQPRCGWQRWLRELGQSEMDDNIRDALHRLNLCTGGQIRKRRTPDQNRVLQRLYYAVLLTELHQHVEQCGIKGKGDPYDCMIAKHKWNPNEGQKMKTVLKRLVEKTPGIAAKAIALCAALTSLRVTEPCAWAVLRAILIAVKRKIVQPLQAFAVEPSDKKQMGLLRIIGPMMGVANGNVRIAQALSAIKCRTAGDVTRIPLGQLSAHPLLTEPFPLHPDARSVRDENLFRADDTGFGGSQTDPDHESAPVTVPQIARDLQYYKDRQTRSDKTHKHQLYVLESLVKSRAKRLTDDERRRRRTTDDDACQSILLERANRWKDAGAGGVLAYGCGTVDFVGTDPSFIWKGSDSTDASSDEEHDGVPAVEDDDACGFKLAIQVDARREKNRYPDMRFGGDSDSDDDEIFANIYGLCDADEEVRNGVEKENSAAVKKRLESTPPFTHRCDDGGGSGGANAANFNTVLIGDIDGVRRVRAVLENQASFAIALDWRDPPGGVHTALDWSAPSLLSERWQKFKDVPNASLDARRAGRNGVLCGCALVCSRGDWFIQLPSRIPSYPAAWQVSRRGTDSKVGFDAPRIWSTIASFCGLPSDAHSFEAPVYASPHKWLGLMVVSKCACAVWNSEYSSRVERDSAWKLMHHLLEDAKAMSKSGRSRTIVAFEMLEELHALSQNGMKVRWHRHLESSATATPQGAESPRTGTAARDHVNHPRLFDPTVAHHLITPHAEPKSFELDSMFEEYASAGLPRDDRRALCRAPSTAAERCILRAAKSFMMFQCMWGRLEQDSLMTVFANVEMPLVVVLAQMALVGVCVDRKPAKHMRMLIAERKRVVGCELRELLETVLERRPEARKLWDEIDLNDAQNEKTLHTVLGGTGPSTSASLKLLLCNAEIAMPRVPSPLLRFATLILERRRLRPLLAWFQRLKYAAARRGRIYPSYNRFTQTGRITSVIQTVPKAVTFPASAKFDSLWEYIHACKVSEHAPVHAAAIEQTRQLLRNASIVTGASMLEESAREHTYALAVCPGTIVTHAPLLYGEAARAIVTLTVPYSSFPHKQMLACSMKRKDRTAKAIASGLSPISCP
jgi:DNA polymerase theta